MLSDRASARANEMTSDRPYIPLGGRPDTTTTTDEPRPIGPFVLAGALGLTLIAVNGARAGTLGRRQRAAATVAATAAATPVSTSPDGIPRRFAGPAVASRIAAPTGDGIGVATDDLGAGPYG